MNKAELNPLRAYLRKSFGCDTIDVQPHPSIEDVANVTIGKDLIGEIVLDDEEEEDEEDRAFFFEMRIVARREQLQDFFRTRFGNPNLKIVARTKKADFVESTMVRSILRH